jgi:hypothetical protein
MSSKFTRLETGKIGLVQEIHTVPVRDLFDHQMSNRCFCSPTITVEGTTLIVTHNSFDQREESESIYDELGLQGSGDDSWANLSIEL